MAFARTCIHSRWKDNDQEQIQWKSSATFARICIHRWKMIRNRYNRNPHPAPDTKQERNTIHLSSQSLNLGGRWATTDDIATIPFHPSLSSAALRESPNSIPWCYLPISSSVFLSFLLFSLSPAGLSSPCQRILRCGHTEFPFLYHG